MIAGLTLRSAVAGAALGCGLLLPGTASAEIKDPSGTYLVQDGRARVRVEKCGQDGEAVCGFVVWMKKPEDGATQPTTDRNNPDPAKAKRALLGHQLILGLVPNSDERFEGRIYNNEDGKSYDVTIWLDRPNRLKVRGCLIAPLCSTQNWTRTTDTTEGELVGVTGAAGGPTADPEWATAAVAGAKPARAAAPKRDVKPKS